MNDTEKRGCDTCAYWRRFADGRGQPTIGGECGRYPPTTDAEGKSRPPRTPQSICAPGTAWRSSETGF